MVEEDFLKEALRLSNFSRDRNTQVGAVIVSPYGVIRARGFNRFPAGLGYTHERLNDRDLKNRLMVHAERAALMEAAKNGVPVQGCTMYTAATDISGLVWGGCPCTACTIEVIEAGISELVSYAPKQDSKWADDIRFATGIMAECGVPIRYVKPGV